MNDLERGTYKNRTEIVNLFCEHIIPTIRDNPNLTNLVTLWREGYEKLYLEYNYLCEVAFQASKNVFKKIVQEAGEVPNEVEVIIKEIDEIIVGDRRRRGFSTRSLHIELNFAIQDLIRILLKEGMHDICSQYALIKTTTKNEAHIVNFTFASEIEKIEHVEEMLKFSRYHDPLIIWKYFELACFYWTSTNEEINKELRKENPFHSMVIRNNWEEIAKTKYQEKNLKEPIIFTNNFFKVGLRTLINSITTDSLKEERNSSI